MTAPKPPDVGKALSVKVDQQLYDDLTTLMRTGATLSNAVRWAVELGADLCRLAWEHGGYPEGAEPKVVCHTFAPYDAPSDATTPEV